jgi:hypothetical protein
MKILVAASLLIAIAGTAISIFGQIQVSNLADNKVVAGTIRRIDGNGWFVLNDKNHTPINIAKIEIVGSNILIHYSFTASTIHSFIVTPDETLAASGFFLGAAVHRDYAAITLSQVNKNGSAELIHPSAIRSKFGNIWIHGLFSVD